MIVKTLVFAAGVLYVWAVVLFRKHRAWLSYYLLGAFGLTLILAFGARYLGLEKYWESAHLYQTYLLSSWMGIKARLLSQDTIAVTDPVGWITLRIGIECSGILESSVIVGLVSFYPAFTVKRKLSLLGIGLAATVTANIVRILIIVAIVHFYGREAVFISHAIVGRLFFFATMIVLFWYILTRPTVNEVGRMVSGQSR
jgi:exosortase family protein XrtG